MESQLFSLPISLDAASLGLHITEWKHISSTGCWYYSDIGIGWYSMLKYQHCYRKTIRQRRWWSSVALETGGHYNLDGFIPIAQHYHIQRWERRMTVNYLLNFHLFAAMSSVATISGQCPVTQQVECVIVLQKKAFRFCFFFSIVNKYCYIVSYC